MQGARTYICGLVSSMVPYIINHAGEEVEARRDVMWEQEDADSLRKKYADKWKSQREEDVVWKQINVSFLVAADWPPAPSETSKLYSLALAFPSSKTCTEHTVQQLSS